MPSHVDIYAIYIGSDYIGLHLQDDIVRGEVEGNMVGGSSLRSVWPAAALIHAVEDLVVGNKKNYGCMVTDQDPDLVFKNKVGGLNIKIQNPDPGFFFS